MPLPASDRLTAVLLAGLAVAVYAPALGNGFVNFDDDLYVSENPHVLSGVSGENLSWAWTTLHAGYYQPVTWVSFQLDAELFGPKPWGFHLANVLWHAANVVLVFVVLKRMTGAAGRSAAVAALFAVHPLHVESVAWVTERKDVLSLFFGLLALLAYARYAERPGVGRYGAVLAAFALALLAKPMLVTLPCVLLLLDFWPLHRAAGLPRLLAEKLPLLALAAAAGVATVHAQNQSGALLTLERLPVPARVANAVVAYTWYLGKTILPADLAPFYPHPGAGISWWRVAGSAAILLAVTAAVLAAARRRPYLAVGWLWFVGTLVPVLGLLQAGDQAVADRFAYYPHLGLFVLLVWGGDELRERWGLPADRSATVLAAACLVLAVLTVVQIGYWEDSVTVLEHAIRVEPDNPVAHYTLGGALLQKGKVAEAVKHFAEAVRLDPNNPKARFNLGLGLVQVGRPDEAVPHYREAIRLQRDFAPAHYNLGVALLQLGQIAAAVEELKEAVRIEPAMTAAHVNLGLASEELGDLDGAVRHLRAALEVDPNFKPSPHLALGRVRARAGRIGEAAEEYRAALRLAPEDAGVAYQLGRVLAREGKWGEAEEAFRRAVAAQPRVLSGRCALARALARQGREGEARDEYRQAFRLNPEWPRGAAGEAWRLATDPDPRRRDGWLAVELAEEACDATDSREPRLVDALAAAYAEVGQFDRAEAAARRALALAAGDATLSRSLAERLELYKARRPYRSAAAGER